MLNALKAACSPLRASKHCFEIGFRTGVSRTLPDALRRLTLRFAHTTKTQVIGSRVGLALAASTGDVTCAILVGAEKRSATLHPFAYSRLTGIETVGRSGWIHRDFAAGCQGLIVVGTVPVGSPFPHVARHVEQAVSIGRERAHRRGSHVSVFTSVCVGKVPLESIRHRLAAGHELVAPVVTLAVESAA